VHQFLQVKAHLSVCANDYVGAHAAVWGNIAVGIFYLEITGVILNILKGQGKCRISQFLLIARCLRFDWKAIEEEDGD